MHKLTRRTFLTRAGQTTAAAGWLVTPAVAAGPGGTLPPCPETSVESLNGAWSFRLDPDHQGEAQGWYQPRLSTDDWAEVTVPHTWQVSEPTASYLGVAWYHRAFDAPAAWSGRAVRLRFEAVFHSARVWLNGKPIGEHIGKGYTAFTLDTAEALRLGEANHVVVQADNSLNDRMLPRGESFDWTPDGGLIRPVSLLVTPAVFIERVDADPVPELDGKRANLSGRVVLRNTSSEPVTVEVGCRVIDPDTGRTVVERPRAASVRLEPRASQEAALPDIEWRDPLLWHFDHPHLYGLEVEMERGGVPLHKTSTHFGIRELKVKNAAFYLNGERVWLTGVERMAGSNPDFGMAETGTWIEHDHHDLKELNCVFTRVHWQQDERVLDYCDRHGILLQEEVPAWGADTFKGMTSGVDPDIMRNGLEQLREMIGQHRSHPCIVAWGLCNEVNGQNPPAQEFIRRMAAEARQLDPRRLLTYASNSLEANPEKDIAGALDFVSWNEYYETWAKGNTESVRRNLELIRQAFPEKPIVISEYGYCECAEGRVGGDPKRIEILKSHNRVYRESGLVAGAIFFDYNDYRTLAGDKGIGVLKQRVHGVVDLYGSRKPSFEILRSESSPVEDLEVKPQGGGVVATVTARRTLPAYPCEGYSLRWIVYGFDDLPMEKHEKPLPRLDPGQTFTARLSYETRDPMRVQIDVMRPTGFSALTAWWKA